MGESGNLLDYPDPSAPCPCESGRKGAGCCFNDGSWHKAATRIPHRKSSGLVTSGCYASSLRDCDGQGLSREHFISRALLEEIGGSFEISGYSHVPDGKFLSPKSFNSKILCKRHNSLLSDLDFEGARLFRALKRYLVSGQGGFYLFSGDDLERWMMKMLVGLVATGAPSHKTLGASFNSMPDSQVVEVLFGRGSLSLRAGMGLAKFGEGNVRPLAVSFYSPGDDPGIRGLRMQLYGVGFQIMLRSVGEGHLDYRHRPRRLNLNNELILEFSWERFSQNRTFVSVRESASEPGNDGIWPLLRRG